MASVPLPWLDEQPRDDADEAQRRVNRLAAARAHELELERATHVPECRPTR